MLKQNAWHVSIVIWSLAVEAKGSVRGLPSAMQPTDCHAGAAGAEDEEAGALEDALEELTNELDGIIEVVIDAEKLPAMELDGTLELAERLGDTERLLAGTLELMAELTVELGALLTVELAALLVTELEILLMAELIVELEALLMTELGALLMAELGALLMAELGALLKMEL